MSTRIQLKQGDEIHDAEVSHGSGSITVKTGAAEPCEVRRLADGSWQVDDGARRRRCHVVARGDRRWVFCEGRVHVLDLVDPDEDSAGDATAEGRLTARLPGKVTAVAVAAGDSVTAGRTLVILESMKMETEVKAEFDGRVRMVGVAPGQIVGQGDLLVELEPADGGAPE